MRAKILLLAVQFNLYFDSHSHSLRIKPTSFLGAQYLIYEVYLKYMLKKLNQFTTVCKDDVMISVR